MTLAATLQPSPLGGGPDLERLSGPAIRAFFGMADAWALTRDEQRALLGGISLSTYHRWKRDREADLMVDQLERISHLLGIYKSLQILLPTTADGWVKRPNSNPLFGGEPAINLMVKGGITGLRKVRAYLDAQRGGWA